MRSVARTDRQTSEARSTRRSARKLCSRPLGRSRSSLRGSPTRQQDQDDPDDQHARSNERRHRHAFAFAGLNFQRPRVHDRISISPEDSAPEQDDHADGHKREPNDSSCIHSAFRTAPQRFNER
jgi:hypothetical protein